MAGGESGAAGQERRTGPTVCRALAPEHRQGPPGPRMMGQMPEGGSRLVRHVHAHALGSFKGQLDLKG